MPEYGFKLRWDRSSSGDEADYGLFLRAINEDLKDQIKNHLRVVGLKTAEVMRTEVPRSNEAHVHLGDTVETSDVFYSPGGAGGGGFYTFTVSIGQDGVTPQLDFILEGTGIYRGQHGGGFSTSADARITAGEGNITQNMKGGGTRSYYGLKPMPMPGEAGDDIFRTSQRGQRPQTGWLRKAHAEAKAGVARSVRIVGRGT